MTENNDTTLVQRSIFLEHKRDKELREMAHKLRVSKNELIRQLIEIGFRHNAELDSTVAKTESSTRRGR